MGSAVSKPSTQQSVVTTSERIDEKRSMAITHTANVLANNHIYSSNDVVAGLTASKLDAWQEDFDAVSQLCVRRDDHTTSRL
jgi:hypothetical protein